MAQEQNNNKCQGITAVFTGDGKGKTTAALGLALRAAGHDHAICIIQFIKGNWKCGEHNAVLQLGDNVELHVMGKGFTWKSDDIAEDIKLAQKGWQFAKEKIFSDKYELIILDELTYLIHYDMIDEQEVMEVLQKKPSRLHLVITGRYASDALIKKCMMVTEMKDVKHHYNSGVSAQKGFEF